jgi:zinc protease
MEPIMTVKKAGHAKKSVRRLKLKNGLSVLLMENHKSPVVSVQMWVKTGSADETKGEEGISHFIEHLVFKGTDKYGVGGIASTVEAAGGELNAYTSFDQTVFYVNISREFSSVALDVIAEMMGFPKFEGAEIDNEREVVIEEIKRSNDSPSRQASRMLFSTVYKTHPYGIPVIGYDKIIKKVSRKTLVNYYQSRYIPTNMHLVVAGDFDNDVMAKEIDANFGRIGSFKLRKVSRKKEVKQSSPRIKVEKAPFEEAQFHIAWRVPGASHGDIPALDVLAMILGQGESSRLSMKLRMEEPLTTSVGAGTFTPKEEGLFTISASLNADQATRAFEVLKNEIGKMCAEAPSPAEMKRAVTNFESEEFYAMETIEGLARKAGSLENLMGDYAYFQKFMKKVYALKPGDILKAARKYLDPKAMTLVMMTPRDPKATTNELKKWVKSYSAALVAAKKTKPSKVKIKSAAAKKVKWDMSAAAEPPSDIEMRQLKSGTKVYFRVSAATPVISARAAILGGLRAESPTQTGVTELISRVWTSGTETMSEAEIQLKIENMAGGLGAFGGRNSMGLSMQTISPFEDEALDLFSEVLLKPVLSEAAVEREKIMMLETIRSREDNPSQQVSQMFVEEIFKGNPYERDLYGTKETVQELATTAASKHLKSHLVSRNLSIVITGSVDPDKWIAKLERETATIPKGEEFKATFPKGGPSKEVRQFKSLKREQSHIMIGFKGLTITDPKRYTLQIMQSVLAGQGGRLFLELRDKASLAYSVSPMRMEGLETGYFGAYIGCSPEKGTKAIEMLQVEFKKLQDKEISASELDRAKRYLIGRHDIDLQRNSSIGSGILFNEIYGIPGNEIFEYAKSLRDVTAKDVQNVARQIFNQPFVLCAVGPTQPW